MLTQDQQIADLKRELLERAEAHHRAVEQMKNTDVCPDLEPSDGCEAADICRFHCDREWGEQC